ncbi:MAG: VWA domain-containing protein [Polyangiales bacterium]|nr:VWA domain-containing protein [Myxococcales bacterium]MCB9657899.1 VWA domain-containing protein [Sandaracinaceae bacterium]
MTFAAPAQLAWLSLLVPLVLLYVLRRRRERRVVASTLLWESALRDLRAERPFRRLVPHLSLLLQALAVVLGALSLARPSGAARVPEGAHVAFVVDTSLSMGAHGPGQDGRDAPLERARRLVQQRAQNLPPGSRALVVAAGTSATLLSPLTSDRAALVRAVEGLRVGCAVADLGAALDLAAERLADAPSGSEVVLLTDLAQDAPIDVRGLHVPVRVTSVLAETGDARRDSRANTGIVAADARPDARASEDARDAVEIFVRVAHFGAVPQEVFVTASASYDPREAVERGTSEERVLASQRVVVSPDEPSQVVLRASLPPDAHGRAPFVRVKLSADQPDALALDDEVWLPSPGRSRLPVFLVGEAPRVVERVLGLDPDVELFQTDLVRLARRASSGGAEPRDAAGRLEGLVVYTGDLPSVPEADAPVLVVRPSGADVFGVTLGARASGAQVTRWQEDDPLLRFVGLTDVELAEVRALGDGARPLVHTTVGAAIGVIPRSGPDITVVSVDPDGGSWARTPGFVIFFRNLIEQARALRSEGGIPAGEVGMPLRVPAPPGSEVSALAPDGSTLRATSRAGVAILPVPPLAGPFVVDVAGHTQVALRHLLRAEASDLRPRSVVAATEASRGEGGVEAPTPSALDVERALHPLFALALLLVCALEVGWATRRSAA